MQGEKTILLADDEALIAMAEASVLEKHGFDVVTVYNGKEAVDTISRRDDIDLVLMDIDLGRGMDGTEAAERILEKRDIPIVFLSSHTEPEIVEKTEKITSYGYVVKDSGETVLIASIKMAFRLYQAHRELKVSEERYHSLYTNINEGVAINELLYGEDGSAVDYTIIDVNPQFERITGLSRDMVVGRPASQVYKTKPPPLLDLFAEVARTGEGREIEYTFSPAQRIFSISVFSPGPGRFVAGFSDITEQKKTQDQLSEIFKMSLDPICIADINTSRFLTINPAFHEILGYRDEELLSRSFFEFIHPEDAEKTAQLLAEKLKKGERVISFENRFLCKEGGYRWFDWVSHPVPEQGITYAIAHDITERKAAEKEILESRSRYKNIFDNSLVPMLEEDISELRRRIAEIDLPEGCDYRTYFLEHPDFVREAMKLFRMTDVNHATIALYEAESKKDFNITLKDLYVPEAFEAIVDELIAVAENMSAVEGETVGTTFTGRKLYLYKRVSIPPPDFPEKPILVSLIDITEQKKLNERLHNARKYLERIINTAADPIFVKDRNHRFVLCNDAFCQFLGRERDEILGKSDPDFFPPEQVAIFWKNDDEVFYTGEMSLKEESFTNAAGEISTIVTRKALYTDELGGRFVVGVIRDITAEKIAQDGLAKALEENKALLGELQHRVKNSFNIISSLIKFETDAVDSQKTKAVLQKMRNRIISIANLYTILDVSDNIRTISLKEYIGEILESVRESFADSPEHVHIEFQSDALSVDTKKAMACGLIVNELVTNSLKYAFPETAAGRKEDGRKKAGRIAVSIRREEGCSIEVRDNGAGLPDGFDLETSSGLGLRLVNMLAAQHEGTVSFSSGADGTVFTVRVP